MGIDLHLSKTLFIDIVFEELPFVLYFSLSGLLWRFFESLTFWKKRQTHQERDRDRETTSQRDTERHTHTHTERERERERETNS